MFHEWSLLEWMLINWRACMQELSCRLISRMLRRKVQCLMEGFSRLDVSTKARRCAVTEFVYMFGNPVHHRVPNEKYGQLVRLTLNGKR
eukprot:scaffold262326_cov21-Tisochrysis_lutea.AAC.1